jgi:hypothetical protein
VELANTTEKIQYNKYEALALKVFVSVVLDDPRKKLSIFLISCFSWGICYEFYGVKSAAGG